MTGVDRQHQQETLWQGLLQKATRRSSVQDGTILFMGDALAGKTSLVDRFCSATRYDDDDSDDEPRQETQGHPLLSYSFFDAIDPSESFQGNAGGSRDADEAVARISVWSLSDTTFKELLSVPLAEGAHGGSDVLARTVCLIALDLSRPWTFDRALKRWMAVAREVVGNRLKALPEEGRSGLLSRQVSYLARCYGTLHEDEGSGFRVKALLNDPASADELHSRSNPAQAQLPAGVLEVNVGVPVVVVGLKADVVKSDNFEEEQRSLYVQQYLRSFCLKHGATLAFVSAHNDVNRLLLQRYLLHRLYPESVAFQLKGQVSLRKEDLFVPAGWDSTDLISKLMTSKVPWSPNATYNEVIVPPKPEREKDRGGESADSAANPSTTTEGAAFMSHTAWLEELQLQLEALGSAPVQETRASVYTQKKEPEELAGASKPEAASGERSRSPQPDNEQIRSFFEGLLAGGGPSKK